MFSNQANAGLTCAALDGPDSGSCAGWRGSLQQGVVVVLRAALVDGSHIAVTTHAETARQRQVQRVHRLRLQLAEHRLAHRLELSVHLHLAHLGASGGSSIIPTETLLLEVTFAMFLSIFNVCDRTKVPNRNIVDRRDTPQSWNRPQSVLEVGYGTRRWGLEDMGSASLGHGVNDL